jgi:oligosaccharyltransferase complex subunit epsilon
VFAVVNGALLGLYLILNGSFPYNSFLAAFIAAVAFFVFTVCLRVQISRPADFGGISAERAYAEYVICNVILFFAVITFIG